MMAYIDTSTLFGNTATSATSVILSNNIMGSAYIAPSTGPAQSISAYVDITSTNRNIKAAIYSVAGALLGSTDVVTGLSVVGAQWVTMPFSSKPNLVAGTTYILVVWADQRSNGSNQVSLYYSGTSANAGKHVSLAFGSWPASPTFTSDNNQYCIYATCTTAQTPNGKAAIYSDSPNTVLPFHKKLRFLQVAG